MRTFEVMSVVVRSANKRLLAELNATLCYHPL